MKITVTLDPETLRLLDALAGGRQNRSRTVEAAIHELRRERERRVRDAPDREIIDRVTDCLNREMADVLDVARYAATAVSPDEFGTNDDPLAWDADGWDDSDAAVPRTDAPSR